MATPSSGNPISFGDIESEFGQASGTRSIGKYVFGVLYVCVFPNIVVNP